MVPEVTSFREGIELSLNVSIASLSAESRQLQEAKYQPGGAFLLTEPVTVIANCFSKGSCNVTR